MEHGFIAGYEIILKYIRQKQIDGNLGMAVNHIEMYDHIARQVLIKYMSDHSDMETDAFYDKIIDNEPNLEGDVMTVAEQWKQQGLQQGLQQGALESKKETAINLSRMGLTDDKIVEATGLERSVIKELKQVVSKKIQH